MPHRGAICFIGAMQNHAEEVDRAPQLPGGIYPLVGLCVWMPAEEAREVPQLAPARILLEDGYRELDEEELAVCYDWMKTVNRRGDWLVGRRMSRRGNNIIARRTVRQKRQHDLA